MTRTMWVAGAVAAAAWAAAGTASASDDCATTPFPGFYTTACLFDEHAYAYSYCGDWGCYSNSGSTNNLVNAYRYGPGGSFNAYAAQSTNSYDQCGWGSCYGYDSEGTNAGASGSMPLASAGLGLSQYEYANEAPWGDSEGDSTNLYGGGSAAGQYANVNVNQYSYAYEWGSYCNNNVYVSSSVYYLSAYGPCEATTPAGPASLHVPMLHATCVPTPVPEAAVCGRFPDMPDGTGLPFL